MALVQQFLASLRRDEEGQGLAEYALILALIAIVAIIALIFLGGQVSDDPQQRRRTRSNSTASSATIIGPPAVFDVPRRLVSVFPAGDSPAEERR